MNDRFYTSLQSLDFSTSGVLSTRSPILKQKVTMYIIPVGIKEPYKVDFLDSVCSSNLDVMIKSWKVWRWGAL